MRKGSLGALVALVVVLGALAPMTPSGAAGPESSWIVTLVDSADPSEDAPGLAQRHGGRTGHVYEHALNGFQFLGSEQAAANLSRNPRVRTVVPDDVVHAVVESAPTGVRRIDAPAAHTATHRGSGAVVAVIDTGIDLDHPDLAQNVHPTLGKDCTGTNGTGDDDNGHGTHVAGTIAAVDDNDGVIGVAPAAKLVPVKVLTSSGSGSWSDVICGIDYATANAATIDVANMSLGGSGSAGSCTDGGMRQAICTAVGNGVTFIVAAGNDSRDASRFVPAAYPEAITVSAFSDRNGSSTDNGCSGRGPWATCDEVFASFSNHGSIVDVMAPGVSISSTVIGGYGSKSGTSMAAPHVAGVAALVIASGAATAPADVASLLRASGECPGVTLASASGTCSGEWSGDPDGVAEPMVNAARAAAGTTGGGGDGGSGGEDPPSGFSLSASGYKVKGVQHADLTWSGTVATSFDVYRGGSTIATNVDDNTYTDDIGAKGGGSYTYKVCEAGTSTCSAEVTVTF